MFCNVCGNKLSEDLAECRYCGNKDQKTSDFGGSGLDEMAVILKALGISLDEKAVPEPAKIPSPEANTAHEKKPDVSERSGAEPEAAAVQAVLAHDGPSDAQFAVAEEASGVKLKDRKLNMKRVLLAAAVPVLVIAVFAIGYMIGHVNPSGGDGSKAGLPSAPGAGGGSDDTSESEETSSTEETSESEAISGAGENSSAESGTSYDDMGNTAEEALSDIRFTIDNIDSEMLKDNISDPTMREVENFLVNTVSQASDNDYFDEIEADFSGYSYEKIDSNIIWEGQKLSLQYTKNSDTSSGVFQYSLIGNGANKLNSKADGFILVKKNITTERMDAIVYISDDKAYYIGEIYENAFRALKNKTAESVEE